MFWGLVLKTNKRYSQSVTKAFHVSQATLDVSSTGGDAIVEVWLHTDGTNHLLCNLSKQTSQVPLDLAFTDGETVAFFSKGTGTVHLSGYLLPDDDFDLPPGNDESEDEELDDESVDVEELDAPSKKVLRQALKSKNQAADEDEDDDDDSDEDFDGLGLGEDDDEDDLDDEEDGEEDDDEDDDEDDEDEDDDSDEEELQPPAKLAKLEKQAKVNGVANGKATKVEQKKDQNQQQKKQKQQQQQQKPKEQQKNQQKPQQQQQNQQKPQPKTLQKGVIVEDIRTGKGPEAKPGKNVEVYYEGRLKNGKVFDSSKTGAGFKFTLGRGEVIQGWDIGVSGMRVGSKRRITCPPHAAYGPRGQPPVIPPNSTLVFDVELRGIK